MRDRQVRELRQVCANELRELLLAAKLLATRLGLVGGNLNAPRNVSSAGDARAGCVNKRAHAHPRVVNSIHAHARRVQLLELQVVLVADDLDATAVFVVRLVEARCAPRCASAPLSN
jgi:hypothetical protein